MREHITIITLLSLYQEWHAWMAANEWVVTMTCNALLLCDAMVSCRFGSVIRQYHHHYIRDHTNNHHSSVSIIDNRTDNRNGNGNGFDVYQAMVLQLCVIDLIHAFVTQHVQLM